jgi:hypothetical protein
MTRGKSLAYKPGAGANRDYWGIKKWLRDRGITQAEMARALEVDARNISATIRGLRNHRQVLQWLAKEGCPAKYLSLPEDLKGEARD